MPLTVEPLFVCLARAREGGLLASVRYSYEVRPASPRQRTKIARSMMCEALDRLDGGEGVALGFGEDAVRRVRTDRMQA